MGFRSFIGQQQPLGLIVLLLLTIIISIQQPLGQQLIQQPLGWQLTAISRPLGQQLATVERPLGPTVKQRMGQRGRT